MSILQAGRAILATGSPGWTTIPQPGWVDVVVAAAGVALILLELWWFLGRHGQGVAASENTAGVQEITIVVDGGYSPSHIRVKAGRPLRLTFHRRNPSSCVAQVLFPDFHRSLDLPLDAAASLELEPIAPGSYPFHCGMNMVRGTLNVE